MHLSHRLITLWTQIQVTLVIDCPTPAHIPSLVSNSIWKPYQAAKDGIWPVYVVWHRWGTFPESPEYQAWMASFGPDAQHLSGDASLLNNQSSFESSAVCNAHFNLLDPSMFPREPVFSRAELPRESPTSLHMSVSRSLLTSRRRFSPSVPPNVYPMRPGMIIDILPRKPPRISQGSKVGESGPGDSLLQVLSLKPDALLEGVSERLPKFIEEIEIAQEAVVDAQLRPPTSETPQPGDDIVVTPLGTGSSLPSKYRNVSATHLAVPGVDGDILLDCGEGTLGQLTRRFGHEEGGIAKVLAGLKVIFISHLHADHHTGLARLLRARRDVSELLISCRPARTVFLTMLLLGLRPLEPALPRQHPPDPPAVAGAPSHRRPRHRIGHGPMPRYLCDRRSFAANAGQGVRRGFSSSTLSVSC